jgi:drug/metabolite transporter (DMT)-like permease
MHEKAGILPYLACLVAATMWGLLWYPLRLLQEAGLPGIWATLVIYVSAIVVVLPRWLHTRHIGVSMPLLMGIAVSAGWTNLAFILALLEGTVVRVLLLFYLSPLWAILLARVFLHETITWHSVLNLLLAGSGAVILLADKDLDLTRPVDLADGLAITAGMAFAVTNLLVRKIGDIPIISKMVPAWIGVLGLSLAGVMIAGVPLPVFSLYSVLLGAGVGIFGMVLMTYTAQYAVTHLPLQKSAVIFLFEVPVGAVSAAILSAETMTLLELLGGSLVLLAAWLTSRRR